MRWNKKVIALFLVMTMLLCACGKNDNAADDAANANTNATEGDTTSTDGGVADADYNTADADYNTADADDNTADTDDTASSGATDNTTDDTTTSEGDDSDAADDGKDEEEVPDSPTRVKVDPSLITYADNYKFDRLTYDGLEEKAYSCLLEAESVAAHDALWMKSDSNCSGGGFVDITDNNAFSLTVDIPASQYYKITVRHCAGSHKENPLLFNGSKAMDIVSEQGPWVETTVDGVFLEKGKNTITLGAGWSWFSLDSIFIENGESLDDDIFTGVTDTLSNPYANLKTQNIYQYLKAVYGKRTLAGQCTNYGTNTETDALYLGLGKYPAVRTFDFIYDSLSFCNNRPSAKDVDLAIDWSNDGGIVVYDWHWYAPCNECEFYAENTSFTLSKAVTKEDIAHMDYADIQKLYADGKISKEAIMLVADIDNISKLMQRMEDNNVTVLWRPLHEASGGWFWWGSSGVDAYQWLWKLLYERMTDYHELDNLIWVWNGQHKDWYPGDEYCDIVAMDVYGGAHDYGTSPSTLAELASWCDNKKLVAMSECATMPDPDLIIRDHAYWLWFAVWNWDYIVVNGTTELSDAYTSFDMMKKVYNSEVIITRDELPKF